MSIELMREIATKMTESGVPIDPQRFTQAYEDSCERRSYGSVLLYEYARRMMADYLYGLKGYLYPGWSPLVGEDGIPYYWKSTAPNVFSMPFELLKATKGVLIDIYQGENYARALILKDQLWIDHYQSGGNLWDLVREAYGSHRDQPTDIKEDFFKGIYGKFSPVFKRAFPDLVKEIVSYQNIDNPQTLYGGSIRRVKMHDTICKLGIVSVHSVKDAIRIATLQAYAETGVAPYCIHHGGCIAPLAVAEAYAAQYRKLGFRVDLTYPQAAPKPFTRFQVIEADD